MMHAPNITMPFDLSTALVDDRWRADAIWPLPLSATRDMMGGLATALRELGQTLPEPMADVVVLSGPWVISAVGALADVAMQTEAAASRGMRLVGRERALAWFAQNEDASVAAELEAGVKPSVDIPRSAFLRRMVRTATLNRASTLPRAFAAPRHIAISHNSLLMDVARRGAGGIGFRHGAEILAQACAAAVPASHVDATELARIVESALLAKITLSQRYLDRLQTVISPIILARISEAAADLNHLRQLRNLPKSVWSGTAGYYPARAVNLEVKRRGGQATVFDHGGCTGMFAWEMMDFGEFRPATRFVTMSRGIMQLMQSNPNFTGSPAGTRPEFVGHDGEDTFAYAMRLPKRPNGPRPRVVYPLGSFYGFRQYYPSILPDVIYYDFLMRTAKMLTELPIDLVCKPRPSAKKSHPVEAVALADFRLFEFVLPEADVVLFDDVHSTTFWQSLCSDRGVVLIDVGHNRFVPKIEALIRERCRVVSARYSDRNIPAVDKQELSDAISQASTMAVDPSAFCALLARDPAGSGALDI